MGALRPSQVCSMDFKRAFEVNAKCNNINHVWSHFYKILGVLKYHRCPFDTDISRQINTNTKGIYLRFLEYLCSHKCLCQRYWFMGVYSTLKLPKVYRNDFKPYLHCCMGGLKCLPKIHSNTQWGGVGGGGGGSRVPLSNFGG